MCRESPAAAWDHCHDHGYVRGPLTGAEDKLAQLDATLRPATIHLGLPTFGQVAGRSNLP
ncbi:endonuclease domain-containing protein [Streptomyces tricolor]